jgi:predicted dehydrogenase
MNNKPVNFGIIGAGEIVRACAHIFKDNPDARAVAVADVDRAAAQRVADELGASSAVGDYRDLLRNPGVQAIYVATPPFLHKAMVLDCLAAGKHILCEKPFAMNAQEVREIAAAAQSHPNLKVACCSSRFLQLATLEAKRAIDTGSLGKLERIAFEMSRSGIPAPIDWTGWKAQRSKAGGGLLMDWGCYDLDWLTYVLGNQFRPAKVFATLGRYVGDVETTFAVQILCHDGLRLDWQRRGAEHGPTRDLVEFRGDKAGLDLAMIPSNTPPTHHTFNPADQSLHHSSSAAPFLRDWKPAMAFPVQDLTRAILEDRQPLSPPSRQILIHDILDAAYRSAASAQVVSLPE